MRITTKQIEVAIAIIRHQGKVLICQRRATDSFANLWEFPGGKLEPGETPHQCLTRELQEELGIVAMPTEPFTPIEHQYPTISVHLLPFLCTLTTGTPQPLASQQLRWIAPSELRMHPFPAANAGLIEEVISRLTGDA